MIAKSKRRSHAVIRSANRATRLIEALEDRQLLSCAIDIRQADGSKFTVVSQVGQVVNLQIWAVVTGADNNGANDGFESVVGSMLATAQNANSVHGNLGAQLAYTFSNLGSQNGTPQDLNGDGSLDVGSNNNSSIDNFFYARSIYGLETRGGVVSGASNSFQIGTLTYTVTSLAGGGETDLNFRAKAPGGGAISGIWMEDGTQVLTDSGGVLTGSAPFKIFGPAIVTGSISGNVFNDINGNGQINSGDTGIAGITVYNDANNNSRPDPGEFVTTTDAGGNYQLGGLPAGNYKIRQVLPSGWKQTTPANNYGWTLSLTTGQNLVAKNFGQQRVGAGSISGSVFNDLNGNGQINSGETGIAGITVYNDANNNSRFDPGEISAVTDSGGNYALSNLAAGNYKIREILPAGWKQTTPANNYGWTLSLSSGQSLTNKVFGEQRIAQPMGWIGGTVFNDANGNLKWDLNEKGVGSGWTVYIDTNNDHMIDNNELTMTTDANGYFRFNGLAAGTYKIRVIVPAGWTQTTPTNNFGQTITIGTNGSNNAANFGMKH